MVKSIKLHTHNTDLSKTALPPRLRNRTDVNESQVEDPIQI